MDKNARLFILASLCFLGLGFAGGVGILGYVWIQGEMPPDPFAQVYQHLMMAGWLSNLAFGLGLYLLPRMSGNELHSALLARLQLWTFNAGVVMRLISQPLSATYGIQVSYNAEGPWLVLAFASGVLELIAAGLFAYNVWRTVWTRPAET